MWFHTLNLPPYQLIHVFITVALVKLRGSSTDFPLTAVTLNNGSKMVEKTLSSSRQSMGQTFSPLGKCLFFFFFFGWIFKGGRRGKRSLILGWYLRFLQVKPCWIGLGFVHVLLHPTSFDTLLLLVSFSSLLSPSYSKRKTTVEEFRPPPYQGQHVAAFTLALLLFVVCCCCFCCCCFCCSFILLLFRFLLFYLLLMFFFLVVASVSVVVAVISLLFHLMLSLILLLLLRSLLGL